MRRQASVITLVLLLVAVLACSASSQTRDVTWDFSGRNWMAPTTGGMARQPDVVRLLGVPCGRQRPCP